MEFKSDREIDGEVIDGLITYYKPSDTHIRYLEELAEKLNILSENKFERNKI